MIKKLWEFPLLWIQWNRRRNGKEIIDLERHAGYFFPVGLLGYSPLKRPHLIKMQSDKMMRAKLLSYKTYLAPKDMIKYAKYQYIGYENETPFVKMTWPEYKEHHYGAV